MNGTLQDKVAVITGWHLGDGTGHRETIRRRRCLCLHSGPEAEGELDEAVDGIGRDVRVKFENWRGRDGNDPSVDIAKDADQRFYEPLVGVATRVATERMFRSRQVLALMGEI